MTTAIRRLAAIAAAGAVASLTACSTKLSSGPPTATTVAPTTTIAGASTPAQTKAASYRAQLTYLMVEQVYLLARATGVSSASATSSTTSPTTSTTTTTAAPAPAAPGATTSPPSTPPSTAAPAPELPGSGDAATALDHNSHDIADLLAEASGYGSSFDSSFYTLWTRRNFAFAGYEAAKAANDKAAATGVSGDVTAASEAIAKLVHSVNKYVPITTASNPATGLADELGGDDTAILTMLDDVASHGSSTIADLVTAAERMYHTADYLAAGAAALDPDQYPGTPTGTAANLRASLTMALVEHVELAALDADQLVAGKAAGPEAAALDANTRQIANIVTASSGDQAGGQLEGIWTGYVGALRSYAKAKASGDSGAAADAAGRLTGVGAKVGAFFHGQDPKVGEDLITADMGMPVTALQAVIDAAASGSPETTSLRVAAGYVPKLASDIAEAIAEQFPERYTA